MKQDKPKQHPLNIINKTNTRSTSKEKQHTKNSLTLFTISNELNKIKHFSKRKHEHTIPNSKTVIKTNTNILTSSLTKHSNGLFNNIPFPEGNTSLKKNNSNLSINKVSSIFPLRFNTTNMFTKKRSVSQSPNHSTHNVIPKTSNDKYNKLKNEIDKLNKVIHDKESIIKEKMNVIKKMEINVNEYKKQNGQLQSKYMQLKKNFMILSKENAKLKEEYEHAMAEISFLNKKEIKLMQVIYLIKEKGINIEDILNDVSQMNGNENVETNRSEVSMTSTVYFQDKVEMPLTEERTNRKVPGLNLGVIPPYVSDSDEEEDDDNDNNVHENEYQSQKVHSNKVNTNLNLHLISNNMKFNKITFSNEVSNTNNDNN